LITGSEDSDSASGASDDDIIEKIDIGGIALIRGAAKNFQDVLIVSSRTQYDDVFEIAKEEMEAEFADLLPAAVAPPRFDVISEGEARKLRLVQRSRGTRERVGRILV
jgi:AICAR transformylase/IMP cyclohydrolase PurH